MPLESNGAIRWILDDDRIGSVYRFMYCHVGNRQDAQNLTEQTFRRVLQSDPSLPLQQSMESHLLQTAHIVVKEYLREFYFSSMEAQSSEYLVQQMLGITTYAIGQATDVSAHIDRILMQLPQRARDLLTQRFLRNDSLTETAVTMHVSLDETMALQWSALASVAQVVASETQSHRECVECVSTCQSSG